MFRLSDAKLSGAKLFFICLVCPDCLFCLSLCLSNWRDDQSQWLIRLKTPKKFTGSKIGVIFWQITSRVTTKKLKIGQRGLFELGPFFSLFLMRKRLSSDQKWFLRPYLPLIRGMFAFRSGLRFSFRALEVLQPRVRKGPFSLTRCWPRGFRFFSCNCWGDQTVPLPSSAGIQNIVFGAYS